MAKITGANVVLRAVDGQQLVNTTYPWGTALGPAHPRSMPVIADKRPRHLRRFIERATNRPVFRGGRPGPSQRKLRYP